MRFEEELKNYLKTSDWKYQKSIDQGFDKLKDPVAARGLFDLVSGLGINNIGLMSIIRNTANKPLSENKFNTDFWKTILRDGSHVTSILENGWKAGIGPNVTLASSTSRRWAPKHGQVYMLIHRNDIQDGGNGPRVPNGYLPKPWQFITHDSTKTAYQQYLEAFTNAQ